MAGTWSCVMDELGLFACWDLYVKRTINMLALIIDAKIVTAFEYHGNIVVVTQQQCVIISPTTNKIERLSPHTAPDQLPMYLDSSVSVQSVRGIENIVFWIDRTRTKIHIAPSSDAIYLLATPPHREYDILHRYYLLKHGVCVLDDLLLTLSCALMTAYRCDMTEADSSPKSSSSDEPSIMSSSRQHCGVFDSPLCLQLEDAPAKTRQQYRASPHRISHHCVNIEYSGSSDDDAST